MSEDKQLTTAESLRLLADWYEEHPEQPAPSVTVHIWLGTPAAVVETLGRWARALKPCKKNWTDFSVNITRQFGSIEFRVSASRDAVCKKIVTYDCPESLLASLGEENLNGLETE